MYNRSLLQKDAAFYEANSLGEESAIDRGVFRVNHDRCSISQGEEEGCAAAKTPTMLSKLREKIGVDSKVLSEHYEPANINTQESATEAAPPQPYVLPEESECTTPRGQVMPSGPDFNTQSTPPPFLTPPNSGSLTPMMGLTDSPKPFNSIITSPNPNRIAGTPPPPQRQNFSKSPAKKFITTSAVRILDAPGFLLSYNQLLDSWGTYLAVPLGDTVYIRSSATLGVSELLQVPEPISSVKFSPSLGTASLAVGYGKTVEVFSLSGGATATPTAQSETMYSTCSPVTSMSHTGSLIACGTKTGHLNIFDTRVSRRVEAHRAHTMDASSVQFSPDKQYIASSGIDGTVAVWCVRQRKVLWNFKQEGAVFDVEWAQHSLGHLATVGGAYGATLAVYNTVAGRHVHSTFTGCQALGAKWETETLITCHGDLVEGPEGDRGVVTPPSSLRNHVPRASINLWKATSSGLSHEAALHGHHEAIWNVALSPDKHHLVSASLDETVRFWELGSTKVKHRRSSLLSMDTMVQIR